MTSYEGRKQNSKVAVFWSKRKRPFGFWIKALEPETNIWCHNFKPLYCNFPFFVCCTQRKDPACHKKCNLLLQVSLSFNLRAHGNKKNSWCRVLRKNSNFSSLVGFFWQKLSSKFEKANEVTKRKVTGNPQIHHFTRPGCAGGCLRKVAHFTW